MGYRFSLINANSVGHLVEGNLLTFAEQTLSDYDRYYIPNWEFIDELLENPMRDFYTSRNFRRTQQEFKNIYPDWRAIRNDLGSLVNKDIDISQLTKNRLFQLFLSVLRKLHYMIGAYDYKTLLLPGSDYNEINRYLTNENTLRHLVHSERHSNFRASNFSYLILQLKEIIEQENIVLLNAFEQFNIAYKRREQWPGVLIWHKDESLFAPVKQIEDVEEIFRMLEYDRRNAFKYINERFNSESKSNKYYYFLHLSDLHFGNTIANNRKVRLVRILEKQRSEIEETAKIHPIITGDLVDSPSKSNRQSFLDFTEMLNSKGFPEPTYILGNHDVNTSGLNFSNLLKSQKHIISSLINNKIDIIPELNIGLIKFDSNTSGEFAQGKIGEEQLQIIGNEIDRLKLLNRNLKFIALVHHHPIAIENPDWYEKEWYERFLGDSSYEKTMKLKDSDLFLQWLRAREISIVFHGHKHIPKIQDYNGIKIIGAGSATGVIKHKEEGKTYMSYNLLKYDMVQNRPLHCSIFVEEIIGAGTQHIQLSAF
jgi:predicted phosphodiesterase